MLTNRIYCGMTVHKGEAFEGEHEAIVDRELWERVQLKLLDNASGASRRKNVSQPSLLAGLVEDSDGRPMTPSHSGKSKKTQRYRYYVTRPDLPGGKPANRVSATDLETIVCEQLAARLIDPAFQLDLFGDTDPVAQSFEKTRKQADLTAAGLRSGSANTRAHLLQELLTKVRLREERIEIELKAEGLWEKLELERGIDLPPKLLTLSIAAVRIRKGHQLKLIVPEPEQVEVAPPQHDRKLIALIAETLEARELVFANPELSMNALAKREGRCRTRLAKLVGLSCLAPDLVRLTVEGRQPRALSARNLLTKPLPMGWDAQAKEFGIG